MAQTGAANVRQRQAVPSPQMPSMSFEPVAPSSVAETGLSMGFLSDLAIKIIYFTGYIAAHELAEEMKLPFRGVVEEILEFLKREQFCEVRGSSGGVGASAYEYSITDKGSKKARDALDRSQYAGATPVTLESYNSAVLRQGLKDIQVGEEDVRAALSHLIIGEEIFQQIGPAVNSSRSIFLFGPPGNGKTTISEAIGMLLMQGDIYVPYSIEVNGQVIRTFDPVTHKPVDGDEQAQQGTATLSDGRRLDRRWVKIRRPAIMVGGELTMEGLDLVWDDTVKYYEAPFQMKANGGMFLVDDFGRQMVRPQDLLNRWIVPLEKQFDFLTLQTGGNIKIPFDVLIVFATNLDPKELVDEAFLRRIRHKIHVKGPTFNEYREIFRIMCRIKKVPYDEHGLAYVLQEYYIKPGRRLSSCQPRDLLDQIIDIAKFKRIEPQLSKELIDQACRAYFVEL